jgi:hypothetical protein
VRSRVPTMVAGEARRWSSPARLLRLLDDGETTTLCRRTRRPQELESHCRLRPDEGGRRDWSCAGTGVLQGDDEELDWLRNKVEVRVREVAVSMMNSTGDARRCCGVRRAISSI